jgi:hypothetical protein
MITVKRITVVYCDKCGLSTWFNNGETIPVLRKQCEKEGWIIKWDRVHRIHSVLCSDCGGGARE